MHNALFHLTIHVHTWIQLEPKYFYSITFLQWATGRNTRVLVGGVCACSWVFHFCLRCSSRGKCQRSGLVHLLGAMTTEREYFFLPLVVSLLWRWEAKGRGVLVICVLAGGTAEPRWCVGMSELYIKNGQGNGLTGSERSPSCSCKLLKLSLCLLLLQMFLWVSLPPGSNLWGAEQHCWKRDSLGSEGWGTSPLHGCWSHNKVTSPCSLLCSEFAQESGILWLLFPLYHLSARLRGVLGHIWKLPLNFDACLVEPAGV